MPVLGPQDVQGIMEMIEALQEGEARERNPLPPGTAQRFIDQMESDFEFSGSPPGRSANQGFTGRIGNPDPVRAPWRGEYDMPGNFERQQHTADSMANDAMLREVLGSERRRTEEDYLEGTFPLAKYPGVEHAIGVAEAGMQPAGGGGGIMTPESAEERRRWARRARELLGMDRRITGREHRGFRRGTKGMGAKQKRAAFRQFLGR